jgi:hypothetical protein
MATKKATQRIRSKSPEGIETRPTFAYTKRVAMRSRCAVWIIFEIRILTRYLRVFLVRNRRSIVYGFDARTRCQQGNTPQGSD